jgi:hypothetical protein
MESALPLGVATIVRLVWLRWSYPRQFEHAGVTRLMTQSPPSSGASNWSEEREPKTPNRHVGGSTPPPCGECCSGGEAYGVVDVMTGTLGGVKRLKRTVEVVRQTCHSMLRQWRLGLFPRAVERCLTPLSVGSSSSVSCDEGLCDVWSRRSPRLRLRGSHP